MEDKILDVYQLRTEEVFKQLKTSDKGLSNEQAKDRLQQYGPNTIIEVGKTPLIYKFLAQFYHLMAILLWIAGILAFISGPSNYPLGYAIFGVIIINALFSFWQEFQAEKAVEELKKLLPAKAKVLRDGAPIEVLAAELVPGDLLILDEGDNISADGRLIQAFELRTNNSTLTGESEPVRKTSDAFLETDVTITEIPNLAFAGTSVAFGSGRAVVTQTGMNTQFGKIANLTQGVKTEQSPLQRNLNRLVRIIALVAVSLGIILFLFSSQLGGFSQEASLFLAIALIVANVPEGLLPSVTLGLAIGVKRLVERNSLIKKLSSVETLGSTNVICTDKTGTLTQNEMTVRQVWTTEGNIEVTGVGYEPKGDFIGQKIINPYRNNLLQLLLKVGSFSNDAKLISAPDEQNIERWKILGDPTEGALLVSAQKGGFNYMQEFIDNPRIYELPFDSIRKMMSSIHDEGGKVVAYIKGAPKEVLEKCSKIATRKGVKDITDEDRQAIIEQNDGYARKALRVLAMAYRQLPDKLTDYRIETVEEELVFIGLQAMMDPPRPEVQNAIDECFTAGIKIIMITGDYGLTAESIARNIGMIRAKDVQIVTGVDLDNLDDGELIDILSSGEVIFARVAPEHKMRVVSTLKEMGKVVAVTGDGVNDAPALKRADIGVAMGITGTDVAKEASEMIITDDNFASIVNAIEEGRVVFDNLRKFISYIFCHLTPEIAPFLLWVFLSKSFGFPLYLSVMLILAIDLGTDTFPALALAAEKPEPGIMSRPPRLQKEPVLTGGMIIRSWLFIGLIEAVLMAFAVIVVLKQGGFDWTTSFFMLDNNGDPHSNMLLFQQVQTMGFVALVAGQIGSVFANRTIRASVFKLGLFSNKWINFGLLFEAIFIPFIIYTPGVHDFFGTQALSFSQILIVLPFPFIVFFAEELRKYFVRKYKPLPGE